MRAILLAVNILGPVVLIYLILQIEPKPKPTPIPSSDVTCNLFDVSGWTPLSREMRNEVALMVGKGKAEILVANSIDCVERNPANPNFGNTVRIARMEWWRLKPPHRGATRTPAPGGARAGGPRGATPGPARPAGAMGPARGGHVGPAGPGAEIKHGQ